MVSAFSHLLLAAGLLAVAPADGDGALADPLVLRPGMTQAEVLKQLGPPKRAARQVLYKRCLEQWLYEAPHFLRIEFDCVQGRRAQILTVHSIRSAKP